MKVIIAGSRTINDPKLIHRAVCNAFGSKGIEITELISGTANGVDKLGERWALKNNIPVKRFPAKWQVDGKLDKQAGFKRNFQMAQYADALILVWDGQSHGSANMLSNMERLGKPIHQEVVR